MTSIDRARIESLVPHAGLMSLWDRVIDWTDSTIVLSTERHRDVDHPLRSNDRLRAVHLCEYGAQSMAVHGGLRASQRGATAPPGLLVALRGVELTVDRIDQLPHALICEATLLIDSDSGWQYAFRIHHDDVLLAQGRAAVVVRPSGEAGPAS